MEKLNAVRLEPIAPFRLDYTVWALRRRAENIVDKWDGETYERVLPAYGKLLNVRIRQTSPEYEPELEMQILGDGTSAAEENAVRRTVTKMLGLNVEMTPFYEFAYDNPELADLALQFRGLKPPRFPTVFEALVNGICCQQLTLGVGIKLLNRLAELYGLSLEEDGVELYAFPRPEDLTELTAKSGRHIGLSNSKSAALVDLARDVTGGAVDLHGLEELDDIDVREHMMSIRGVGPWTADYCLLRGLGRTNVFPADDLGALNQLRRWLRQERPLDKSGAEQILVRWAPFAGMIYFHLLLLGLTDKGVVV